MAEEQLLGQSETAVLEVQCVGVAVWRHARAVGDEAGSVLGRDALC